ncbi:MAG: hypothetical protein K5662_02460 [Lachnospiraceae bacterium]|nr:hypothetical protein [Lachnospiraceae bacterium]
MKIILKRLLTVVVGFILLMTCIIHLTYMVRDYTRLFGFYDLDKNSVDVVFVGTSVTFSSFMPMEAWKEYGIVAYDYCTNVQYENSLRYSLADIERTQSPELIMVDITPFLYAHYAGNETWNDDYYELFTKCNLDSRKYTLDRFALVYEINKDLHGSVVDYLYYYFDIARYHTNNISFDHIDNAEKDINRGYGYLDHNGGDKFAIEDLITDDGHKVELSEREQYYLDKLLIKAAEMDSNIVFYCPPIYFKDPDAFGKKNYLKDYIADQGFTFADFSGYTEKIGLDPKTDLWSYDHFDALGAQKVTRLLSEYIKDNYNIPDRRNDAEFDYMNDDYVEWEALLEEYQETDRSK